MTDGEKVAMHRAGFQLALTELDHHIDVLEEELRRMRLVREGLADAGAQAVADRAWQTGKTARIDGRD